MKPQDFLKERRRLCNSVCKTTPCGGCPLEHTPCTEDLTGLKPADFAKLYDIVAEWSDAHPERTRQSEFLKQFPNVKISGEGYIYIAPCVLDIKLKGQLCRVGQRCNECCRKYWLTPIDESKDTK